jgi:hypothetical membrane protein
MLNKVQNIKKVLKGDASKKQEFIYLSSIIIIFWIGCIIAEIFYPGGISISENYISDHGWLANNPQGAPFFIVCTTTAGFLLIPHFIYI